MPDTRVLCSTPWMSAYDGENMETQRNDVGRVMPHRRALPRCSVFTASNPISNQYPWVSFVIAIAQGADLAIYNKVTTHCDRPECALRSASSRSWRRRKDATSTGAHNRTAARRGSGTEQTLTVAQTPTPTQTQCSAAVVPVRR